MYQANQIDTPGSGIGQSINNQTEPVDNPGFGCRNMELWVLTYRYGPQASDLDIGRRRGYVNVQLRPEPEHQV